jgi:Family of unknown function (DUF5641)
MGGFYERLIGIIKRTITKIVQNSELCDDQWDTLLVEIEATINSRPLTYVAEDDEAITVITPNHFLSHNSIISILPVITDDSQPYSKKNHIVAAWKRENELLQSFWKIWTDEYVLNLRERHQTRLKGTRSKLEFIKESDVILFKPDNKRASWRIGRVVELIKSHDNQIRSAAIKFPSGRKVILPVKLLYPLEAAD